MPARDEIGPETLKLSLTKEQECSIATKASKVLNEDSSLHIVRTAR